MPTRDWKDRFFDSAERLDVEEINKIIDRVDATGEGAVLCCAKESNFVPCINNIAGIVISGSVIMSNFGKFQRVDSRRLYNYWVFFPSKEEGIEIPEELRENTKKWSVGTAKVHMDEGTVTVEDADNTITLLDVDLSESTYGLFRSINKVLFNDKAGICIDTMIPVYDEELASGKMFKGGKLSYISNEHTRAPCTGYAVHSSSGYSYLPYVGFVAHKTIAESIWASLVGNKGGCRLSSVAVSPLGKTKMHMTPMKKYNRYHCAMITNSAQVGGWNPDDEFAYILSFDLENPQQDMKNKIHQKFEEIFVFPILPNWIDVIWKAGLAKGYIKTVQHAGDCTGALAIAVKENWIDLVSQLLEKGDIKL